jgi:hypothetical protein
MTIMLAMFAIIGYYYLGINQSVLLNQLVNLSNNQSHNTENNLNLTKFNRAVLVDTNHIVREIAKQLNITEKD